MPRWRIACINWSLVGAPHAMIYLDHGTSLPISGPFYFETWRDAADFAFSHSGPGALVG